MFSPHFAKIVLISAELLILLGISFTSIAVEKHIKLNSSTKSFGKHQYQILSSPKIKSTGIKLLGKSIFIKTINESLKNDFENQLINENGCVETGGWSISSTSVIDWNKNFVVIKTDGSEDCGGAHQNFGSYAQVYNLTTGKLEVTSLWLKDYKKLYEGLDYSEIIRDSELDKILRELYLKQNLLGEENKEQAEACVEEISFYSSIWATSKGLIFLPGVPFSAIGCVSQVVLPFNKATPFLSERGKKAIQAFKNNHA